MEWARIARGSQDGIPAAAMTSSPDPSRLWLSLGDFARPLSHIRALLKSDLEYLLYHGLVAPDIGIAPGSIGKRSGIFGVVRESIRVRAPVEIFVNANRMLELFELACGKIACASVLAASLAAATFVVGAIVPETAAAHAIAGDRIFPATLAIDDPSVSSELSLPTVDWFPASHDVAGAGANETDVGGELDLLLTSDFGVGISDTWTAVTARHEPGSYGFQNLELSAKYRFYENDDREILTSVGLVAEVGNTGASRVGADSTSTFTPTFYFGKGFGDLPDSMALLKPFAITGTVGLAISQDRSRSDVFQPGISIQYSLQYLKSSVKDYDLPQFVNHLIPLVEAPLTFGVDRDDHSFGGTINPGFVYLGNTWQFGIEAMIPVSADTQHGTGVIAQFHIFLDSFPAIAQPLFGEN